jgi:hypothetical protein
MAITATGLNIELEAGTYYLVWSLTGSASSGPWAAPEALPSVGNTGNGLQYALQVGRHLLIAAVAKLMVQPSNLWVKVAQAQLLVRLRYLLAMLWA